MKKRVLKGFFLAYIVAGFMGAGVTAQTHVSYGGTQTLVCDSSCNGQAVAVDGSNNLYAVGVVSGIDTVNFNPKGSDLQPVDVFGDIYITKWNADGSYGWTKLIRNIGVMSGRFLDAVVDSGGNLVIAGSFDRNDTNFDPNGSDVRSTNGNADIFVTKLSPVGAVLWTKTVGGTGVDQAMGVAVDASDNVYFAGGFEASVNFNSSGSDVHVAGSGVQNSFVTKLSAIGSYGWTKSLNSSNENTANSLAISGNSVVIGGVQLGAVDMDPGATVQLSSVFGSGDAYIDVLGLDGSYQWSRAWGSSAYDEVTTVSANANTLYVGGYISGASVNFNPLGSDVQSVNGSENGFIASWKVDGGYGWTRLIGNDTLEVLSSSIDASGDVYVVGGFTGTGVNFNPLGSDPRSASSGDNNLFISRWHADGSYGWTKASQGGWYSYPHGVAVGTQGSVYVTGEVYSDTVGVNFNQDGSDTHGRDGFFESFVTTWDQTTLYAITNASSSIKLVDSNGSNLATSGVEAGKSIDVSIRDTASNTPIALVTLTLSGNVDWSTVHAGVDAVTGKSFVSGLSAAVGAVGTHSLYVPKLSGQNAVTICPQATSLAEVSLSCPDAQTFTENDPRVSLQTIGDKIYWLVSGLSGTGGVGRVLAAQSSDELAATGVSFYGVFGFAVALLFFSVHSLYANTTQAGVYSRR